jgi:hypothetical protein
VLSDRLFVGDFIQSSDPFLPSRLIPMKSSRHRYLRACFLYVIFYNVGIFLDDYYFLRDD